MSDRLIVGIGNRKRGDDAAGLEVVERIGLSDSVVCHDGEPASLIALWQDWPVAVLVDAVTSGAPAGSVVVIDATVEQLPTGMCHSTHALGPAEAIELARALDLLPPVLMLYGIEGRRFDFNTRLTPEVERAVEETTALLSDAR